MLKKIIFICLISILLVSLGCRDKGPGRTTYKDEEYHKGTKGVTMKFIDNAPPSRLYDGDSMEVIVELKNEGAYPETDSFEGKLRISGVDTNAIGGSWSGGNTIQSNFQGKSQYLPEGGYTTKVFRDQDGVHVPFDADSLEQTVLVHICYKYRTIATADVCVDPDPYEVVQEEKVCTIHDVSMAGGQGGPVAVTKVEEEVGSDNIYFRIYIKNVDSGSVIERSAYNDCPFNLENDDINKVYVEADLPYDGNPDCTPAGSGSDPVRLTNGEGIMFCQFNKPGTESAYITPLRITLDYGYSTSISKDVKLINIR